MRTWNSDDILLLCASGIGSGEHDELPWIIAARGVRGVAGTSRRKVTKSWILMCSISVVSSQLTLEGVSDSEIPCVDVHQRDWYNRPYQVPLPMMQTDSHPNP